MTYDVYYMRPEFFGDGIMGYGWLVERNMVPKADALDKTHVKVKSVNARNLNHLYASMQGEVWSPNGEARELIKSLGLEHTSMSIGDIAVDDGGKVWIVDQFGFREIER